VQAVILAAGRGRRLAPITDRRSKAMLPAAGRPLVERALLPLVEHGVREVVFVVAPDDAAIHARFAPPNDLGIDARFVVQQERRGMAHALGLAAPLLAERFVVSACDSFVPAAHVGELLRAFERADAVLSLLDVEPQAVSRSAAVALDGDRVRRIVEKPAAAEAISNTVSLPLYLLPRRLLELAPLVAPSPRGELELQSLLQLYIDRGGRVIGRRTDWRFQVSTPEDLLALNLRLLAEGEARDPADGRLAASSLVREPAWIDDGVEVGERCAIGPAVHLERGAALGDDVRIRESVVLAGARVPAGATLERRIVWPGGSAP